MKSVQSQLKALLTAASVASLLYFPLGAISDSGTLTVNSNVRTTTCTLLFSGTQTNNATLQLASVTPQDIFDRGGGVEESQLNVANDDADIRRTAQKFTVLKLGSADGGPCPTLNGNNLNLVLESSSVSSVAGVNFLKSTAANSTNALVGIRVKAVDSDADAALKFNSEFQTFARLYKSLGTTFTAAATSGIALEASYMNYDRAPTNNRRSVGPFSNNLTITVTY
jgi:type 1 fimbria pilin